MCVLLDLVGKTGEYMLQVKSKVNEKQMIGTRHQTEKEQTQLRRHKIPSFQHNK